MALKYLHLFAIFVFIGIYLHFSNENEIFLHCGNEKILKTRFVLNCGNENKIMLFYIHEHRIVLHYGNENYIFIPLQ